MTTTDKVIDYMTNEHYKVIKEKYTNLKAECALMYAMLLGSVMLNVVLITNLTTGG